MAQAGFWLGVVGMLFFCFCTTFASASVLFDTLFFFFLQHLRLVYTHTYTATPHSDALFLGYYCWWTCYCRGYCKCCCSWWCCCDEFFRWRIFPRLPTAWGATGQATKTTARRAHDVRYSFRSQIPTQARVFRTVRSVFSPFITNTHSTQRRNPFSTTPLAFP